jgi:hypothetical protein
MGAMRIPLFSRAEQAETLLAQRFLVVTEPPVCRRGQAA